MAPAFSSFACDALGRHEQLMPLGTSQNQQVVNGFPERKQQGEQEAAGFTLGGVGKGAQIPARVSTRQVSEMSSLRLSLRSLRLLR
jgi:hypothetical protein